MSRLAVLAYGVMCYLIFQITFIYMALFTVNLYVPTSLDGPLEGSMMIAILINLGLITLFGVQHSVMARPSFKARWTKIIPEAMERSTFVLATCLALAILLWQWRPMGGIIWDIQQPFVRGAMYALSVLGWVIVLASTFMINHFDLFGLRQVWLSFRGKPYTHLDFSTPGLYRVVRHPLYLGLLIAFWVAPTMSITHLVFAGGMTAYILVGILFEERNLVEYHGEDYENYREQVPKLIPVGIRKQASGE